MGGVFRVRLHPLEPRGAESHGTYYVCNAQEHKARRVRQGNGDARMPPPSGTCARNERRAPAPSPSPPPRRGANPHSEAGGTDPKAARPRCHCAAKRARQPSLRGRRTPPRQKRQCVTQELPLATERNQLIACNTICKAVRSTTHPGPPDLKSRARLRRSRSRSAGCLTERTMHEPTSSVAESCTRHRSRAKSCGRGSASTSTPLYSQSTPSDPCNGTCRRGLR